MIYNCKRESRSWASGWWWYRSDPDWRRSWCWRRIYDWQWIWQSKTV